MVVVEVAPVTPDELRHLGAAFVRRLGPGSRIDLHPDEEVIGEVPFGPGTGMLMTFQPHRSGRGHRDQLVLRIVAHGADGARLAISGRFVVPASALGPIAGMWAAAIERASARIGPNDGRKHYNQRPPQQRDVDQGAHRHNHDNNNEPTAA
jgi:hypothetical protein